MRLDLGQTLTIRCAFQRSAVQRIRMIARVMVQCIEQRQPMPAVAGRLGETHVINDHGTDLTQVIFLNKCLADTPIRRC